MNNAERNYTTTEKECLAVVHWIKYFRPYLWGKEFTVETDHNALKWLDSVKNDYSRLTRWSIWLAQYKYTIRHRPGKLHINADAMTRPPIIATIELEIEEKYDIGNLQKQDPTIEGILNLFKKNLTDGILRTNSGEEFQFINGCLHRIWYPHGRRQREKPLIQLVVPRTMQTDILEAAHDDKMAGHLGQERTYERIRQRFWWIGMWTKVKEWVQSCEECQRRKNPKHNKTGKLIPIYVTRPWEKIAIDIIGPLPRSNKGNLYILTIIDYFTKWPEAFPMNNKSAETVARIIVKEVFTRHGTPEHIITDRGTQFMGQLFEKISELLETKHHKTTAYHPQSDGLVERLNQTSIRINETGMTSYPTYCMHTRQQRMNPQEILHSIYNMGETHMAPMNFKQLSGESSLTQSKITNKQCCHDSIKHLQ